MVGPSVGGVYVGVMVILVIRCERREGIAESVGACTECDRLRCVAGRGMMPPMEVGGPVLGVQWVLLLADRCEGQVAGRWSACLQWPAVGRRRSGWMYGGLCE